MKKLAVIGAGLSGLTVATELKNRYDISIFEKSRGVSGRMSTRKTGDYAFDHGAQYLTTRNERFEAFINAHVASGCMELWQVPVSYISGKGTSTKTGHNKYLPAPTMTSLCKSLAQTLEINLETHITEIIRDGSLWLLTDQEGHQHGPFDVLISSMPHPQFMQLLSDFLPSDESLNSVRMSGCFSLMIGDRELPLPEFKAAKVSDSIIGWIALNSDKPGRNTLPSLIVQSTNSWAELHMDTPIDDVRVQLLQELQRKTGIDYTGAEHIKLHRWRHAFVEAPYGKAYYQHPDIPLYACGDWCLGPKIESAYLSGIELADVLKKS